MLGSMCCTALSMSLDSSTSTFTRTIIGYMFRMLSELYTITLWKVGQINLFPL